MSAKAAASAKKKLPLRKHAIQWYGWSPDLPDQRDHRYSGIHRVVKALPKQVDLRPQCPPVENQGQLGSCTANALAGALEFLELKGGVRLVPLSRLFIYYNERVIEHSTVKDSGAQMRDGIKTLANQGVCAEAAWPYVISRFADKPTPACYAQGKRHRITSYQRLDTLADLRHCLAAGFPFVFGFTAYDGLESPQVAKSGVLNLPKPGESPVGGHAVMAVGYDDRAKRIIARNSWGKRWGQHGYFTMPYDYITNRDLADDLWTIRQ